MIVASLRDSPTNVRYVGSLRSARTASATRARRRPSHAKFATPWAGEPCVNIQNMNGQATYHVKQVLAAIDTLEGKE